MLNKTNWTDNAEKKKMYNACKSNTDEAWMSDAGGENLTFMTSHLRLMLDELYIGEMRHDSLY